MADVDHPDFHVDLIAVTHSPLEVALEVNSGERKILFVQYVCVIDPQLVAEELFHGQMEVMHEAGIVNNPGMIDISETDFDQLSKSHGLKSFLPDPPPRRRESTSPSTPAKWVVRMIQMDEKNQGANSEMFIKKATFLSCAFTEAPIPSSLLRPCPLLLSEEGLRLGFALIHSRMCGEDALPGSARLLLGESS